ncbi:unnamed protein product [Closterium sp. Yama58-4]|nr:unnamed protein product [Closterium sp. Yama58-4]
MEAAKLGAPRLLLAAAALAGVLAVLLLTDYPSSPAASLQEWSAAAALPTSPFSPTTPSTPDTQTPPSCHACPACPPYSGAWTACAAPAPPPAHAHVTSAPGQEEEEASSGGGREGQQSARYSVASCPLLPADMDCRVPGRPATMARYDHLCWRPQACHLPPFDPLDFLHRLRNRVIAFIGDSMAQQQFISLICLLLGPTGAAVTTTTARNTTANPDTTAASTSSTTVTVISSSSSGGDRRERRASTRILHPMSDQYRLSWEAGWQGWNGAAYRVLRFNVTILHKWSTSLCHMAVSEWSNASQVHAVHLDRPDEFLQAYLPQIDLLVLNTGPHWSRWEVTDYHWRFHVSSQPVSPEQQRNLEANPLLGAYTALRTTIAWILNHGRRGGEGGGEEVGNRDAAGKAGSGVHSGDKGAHRGAGSEGVGGAGNGVSGNESKEAAEEAGGMEGVGGACRGGSGSGAPMVVVLGQPSVHTNAMHATCHTLPPLLTAKEVQQLSFLSRDFTSEAAVADANAAHATAMDAKAAAFGNPAADSDPISHDTSVIIPDYLPPPASPWPASSMRPRTSLPVHLLDITGLTSTRPDAHKSKWHGGDSSSDGEQGDCVHWCLPGVPDTWNDLLYAHVVRTGCFPRTDPR